MKTITLTALRLMLCISSTLWASNAAGGSMVLYAATDRQVVEPLLKDFESTHPDIKIVYHDLNSVELYQRFLAERGTKEQADVLWSSAMNLQFKLVNDGYAAPYQSAEAAALPAWAIWKGEAFGTTFEPIVIAYNKTLIAARDVPTTHAELLRLLKERRSRLRGRIATYDPRASGLGYLLHTQDLEANPVSFWNVIRAFGQTTGILEPSTAVMLDDLSSGRVIVGYNALGSYAWHRAASDPNIGIALPSDYTLILSRIAFINRTAPHPREARAWLDYLLSQRGQALLNRTGLFSVRDDVPTGDASASELRRRLGNAFRPIVISTGLLTYLDKMKHELFLERWDGAMNPDEAKRPGTRR